MKLLATTDKIIVSMIQFNGRIYLATQDGVYMKDDEDKFQPLEIVYKEDHATS